GSVFYQKAFEQDDIEPGDSTGFSLSAVLAASPETSLRFGFSQAFQDDTEIGGQQIDETQRTEGVLTIGASSIVARGVLLNALLGIGLNDDAPDYFLRVSMPIQFTAPLFTADANRHVVSSR
ncbi:MAG: hypothetical protein OEQ18_02950, partial [Gammaproteobacteria bacterium]|nr:hypothetical protein [Gammaproteobacteria bacterium]